MPNDKTTLTREELYQRIWSTPTRTLAAEFGISDVAIGKICRKFNIPKPPLGYWRRIETGYKVTPPPLPPWQDARPAQIVIYRTKRLSSSLKPDVQTLVDAERNRIRPIMVSARLNNPHPIVREAGEAGKVAQANTYGKLALPLKSGGAGLGVSRKSLKRALLILDAILKAADHRGFTTNIRDGRFAIVINGTPVKFRLIEKVMKIESKSPLASKQSSYLTPAAQTTHSPTGILTFEIEDYLPDGMTRRWSDRGKIPLEERLHFVMSGLIAAAEVLRLREIEHKEMMRRYREDEARRQRELARRTALASIAEEWIKSRDLTAFLDACEVAITSRESANRRAETEWLTWARAYVRRIDPLMNGELDEAINTEFGQDVSTDRDSVSDP
jgi:hypothetical protein